MLKQLEEIEEKYQKLTATLTQPQLIKNSVEFQRYAKERGQLDEVIQLYGKYKRICSDLNENLQLLSDRDPEIRDLAQEEVTNLMKEREEAETQLKTLLLPKDPRDGKNIFLEIRAGAGGDEAGLFAAGLLRMYCKYAEAKGWKAEIANCHETGIGGFKEVILLIEGERAYSKLKYESGVHRVQRVPLTESQGRIHTSTVTVAVLPEADEVEVEIDPKDLRIDVYRSSGPGGQHVNTTDSAVRITHIPTGIVVTCQDEKSQHKNKAKALRILRARLLDRFFTQQQSEISETRKLQVGSGERSEKIRTYNFPQGRVTDHRIGLTLYKLENVLEGKLDEFIDALIAYYQAEALAGE